MAVVSKRSTTRISNSLTESTKMDSVIAARDSEFNFILENLTLRLVFEIKFETNLQSIAGNPRTRNS